MHLGAASAETRRQLVGAALVAYGVLGLLFLGAGAALIGGALEELDALSRRVGEQRDALVLTVRATSLTVRDAASGLGNVGTSLDAARRSTSDAAILSRSLAGTLAGLSAAMDLEILGARPLEGLAAGFEAASRQSGELASDLDNVGTALTQNASDLETSRADLVELGGRLDRLAGSLEAMPLGDAGPAVAVRIAFLGLLAWLAVPALASVFAGLRLLFPPPGA